MNVILSQNEENILSTVMFDCNDKILKKGVLRLKKLYTGKIYRLLS